MVNRIAFAVQLNRARQWGKALLVVALLATLATPGAVYSQTAAGEVELKEGQFGPPEGAPEIALGEEVKISGSLYITEFFDRKVITAGATVRNTSDRPKFFSYHVALFDGEGNLIGVTSQSSFGDQGLAPGEETQLGSLLISVPEEKLGEVARYQVTLHASDTRF